MMNRPSGSFSAGYFAAGFPILEACNGEEALDVFKRQTGKIQLVLMDISMPQMDGQTCARLMLKEQPQIPMVYMSGDMDAARMPGIETPTMGFLSNPSRPRKCC